MWDINPVPMDIKRIIRNTKSSMFTNLTTFTKYTNSLRDTNYQRRQSNQSLLLTKMFPKKKREGRKDKKKEGMKEGGKAEGRKNSRSIFLLVNSTKHLKKK